MTTNLNSTNYLKLLGIQPWVRRSVLESEIAAPSLPEKPVAPNQEVPPPTVIEAKKPEPIVVRPPASEPKRERPTANSPCYLVHMIEGPDDATLVIFLEKMPVDPRAWRLLDNILKAFSLHRSQIKVIILGTEEVGEPLSISLLYPKSTQKVLIMQDEARHCFEKDCPITQAPQFISTLSLDSLLKNPLEKTGVYQQLLGLLA